MLIPRITQFLYKNLGRLIIEKSIINYLSPPPIGAGKKAPSPFLYYTQLVEQLMYQWTKWKLKS